MLLTQSGASEEQVELPGELHVEHLVAADEAPFESEVCGGVGTGGSKAEVVGPDNRGALLRRDNLCRPNNIITDTLMTESNQIIYFDIGHGEFAGTPRLRRRDRAKAVDGLHQLRGAGAPTEAS